MSFGEFVFAAGFNQKTVKGTYSSKEIMFICDDTYVGRL
jgi:hypothetical protein